MHLPLTTQSLSNRMYCLPTLGTEQHPTFGKVVNRSTFIIKDGKIASAMRGVSSGGHAANVFEALKAV